jgi:hypothetical protein
MKQKYTYLSISVSAFFLAMLVVCNQDQKEEMSNIESKHRSDSNQFKFKINEAATNELNQSITHLASLLPDDNLIEESAVPNVYADPIIEYCRAIIATTNLDIPESSTKVMFKRIMFLGEDCLGITFVRKIRPPHSRGANFGEIRIPINDPNKYFILGRSG